MDLFRVRVDLRFTFLLLGLDQYLDMIILVGLIVVSVSDSLISYRSIDDLIDVDFS